MQMNYAILALTAVLCTIRPATSMAVTRNEPISPIEKAVVKNSGKVELGKLLFFDPRLSKSGTISCNSCHNLMAGGTDNLPSSIGHKWNVGPINSPTVLNSKFSIAQFWDGRAKDLKEQAGGPIANPGEMGSTHDLAIKTIASIPGYSQKFVKAFGNAEVTMDRVQESIAAFEETLVTPDSRFDKWLKGDSKALSQSESAGYDLFKTKGCIGCHTGPAVGGSMFQKFGLVHPIASASKSEGRFEFTKKPEGKGFFKVPTLRNVELTYPYFHDGSVWNLTQAVDIMAENQLGVKLTSKENTEIVAFLRTLTGKQPEFAMPALPASGPETPKPDFN
jgi:cytochrome c peroxidase